MSEPTSYQRYLLEWLGKEDSSAYGECQGADLSRLVRLGFATITGDYPHDGYDRVSLTDAGRAALASTHPGDQKP